MALYNIPIQFASVYGESTYGNCSYNENDPACTTEGGTQPGGSGVNSGGTLTDTGIALIAVVTLACLITAAAIIVKAARRKKPEVSAK